ncbi:hypothetical protein BGZ94_010421, partial [Podila epigama]
MHFKTGLVILAIVALLQVASAAPITPAVTKAECDKCEARCQQDYKECVAGLSPGED